MVRDYNDTDTNVVLEDTEFSRAGRVRAKMPVAKEDLSKLTPEELVRHQERAAIQQILDESKKAIGAADPFPSAEEEKAKLKKQKEGHTSAVKDRQLEEKDKQLEAMAAEIVALKGAKEAGKETPQQPQQKNEKMDGGFGGGMNFNFNFMPDMMMLPVINSLFNSQMFFACPEFPVMMMNRGAMLRQMMMHTFYAGLLKNQIQQQTNMMNVMEQFQVAAMMPPPNMGPGKPQKTA